MDEHENDNYAGGTHLKMFFDQNVCAILIPGSNKFLHNSFVGLLTMVCTVWLDTNTDAKLLYALNMCLLIHRCNTCTN